MSRGSSRASEAYAPPHEVPNQRLPAFKQRNVFRLLVRREVSPQSKSSSKRLWGDVSSKALDDLGSRHDVVEDARQGLISWVEAESLKHLSPKYCPLLPPPRSTIAAAFSPDGKTLASTHGDHTVKIINFQTGNCLKVLSGHRRTPWVVRFHPLHSEILASGSLDNEVRIWDAKTADCIGSRDFYRPIASIAFHAQGEILAVASGHKLFIWVYNRGVETSSPTTILKTRRSLRAVHFHPHGAPFLLTAEVNELRLSDCSTVATPPGYHSAGELSSNTPQQRVDARASVRLLTYSTPSGQYELLLSPIEPNSASRLTEETESGSFFREAPAPQSAMNVIETPEIQADERSNHFSSFDPTNWDLPFLRGWLMGQNDIHSSSTSTEMGNYAPMASTGRSPSLHRSSRSHVMIIGSGQGVSNSNVTRDESDLQPVGSRIQSELATSMTAAVTPSPETPCTVKLRIWPHDIKYPCASLEEKRSRLNIPHAVLCSEMGAHFSPCGRFLAACVACMLPHLEAYPELANQLMLYDIIRPGTSPTRHPISAHQVVYELRIYSLEEATFGSVLASRAIRAANCLTSIQFSPTSEHLLLAYGRRHSSLLKSVFIDGEMKVPVYTILEVYRLSDMELVRVLLSADDEVNVACFHPLVGGGLVYGTKEGRLRIFQYDSSYGLNYMPSSFPDENPP